jgi:HEPN domain-containing protein
MNRSADWMHQAQADLDLARVSAEAGHHEWACFACHQAVEKALKALHGLYIPTRYPDSLPDGAPTDHFGRLQSDDAFRHARSLVDAVRDALA